MARIDERPPQLRDASAHRRAVRDADHGFREDISIRITPDGEESRVDIRSPRVISKATSQQRRASNQADRGNQFGRDNAKRAEKPQTPPNCRRRQ